MADTDFKKVLNKEYRYLNVPSINKTAEIASDEI
jgi:hypothetical protein